MVLFQEVSKVYGRESVINKISIEFKEGLIYGIVGKNGSGKTTILNLILRILNPDTGKIVSQFENTEIGSSFGEHGFYHIFSVRKNVEIVRLIKSSSKEEARKAMSLFGLEGFHKKKFKVLSSGMKQKVSLAAAFLGKPKLVILDEPTNHLDVEGIFALRELIQKRNNQKVSFIITSHHLSELENICNHFYFLGNGRILSEGSRDYYIQNYETLENAYKKIIG